MTTAVAERAEVPPREKILRLEAQMLSQPQVELETIHHFAPGVYARELRIPAGVILTGKIHRTEHLNIVSQGRITVFTEDGGKKEIVAPCTLVSKPGTKRVGYAHEDTVWTCIHPTNETDLDALEAALIAPDYAALQAPITVLEDSL